MISSAGFTSQEYRALSNKLINSSTTSISNINVCVINKINPDTLTATVLLPESSKIIENVPLSFPAKYAGGGAFFMPKEGQLALYLVTQTNRAFVISSAAITRNDLGFNLYPGENIIISDSGSLFKQDMWGASTMLSRSAGFSSLDDAFSNNTISSGSQDYTVSSKTLRGLPADINTVSISKIANGGNVRPLNKEEIYSSVQGIKSYSVSDILVSNEINADASNKILKGVLDIKALASDFNNTLDSFSSDIDNANNINSITSIKKDYSNRMSNKFKLARKASVVIQKGNVTTANIDTLDDALMLTDADFEKSPEGNNLVLKVSVIDADTQQENATISIDSKGIAHMKFNKLVIDAPQGCIINGKTY